MKVIVEDSERNISVPVPSVFVNNRITISVIEHYIKKYTPLKWDNHQRRILKEMVNVLVKEYSGLILVEVMSNEGERVIIRL